MSFLNLSLLAGTALVGLPVLLHLVMRQRPRPLEFPALRFLQPRHETNQRRLRLRHLLLLLLRMAVIGLLALALARPSVKFSGSLGSQKAPVAAALVFDTARRMEYVHENDSRLDVAKPWGLSLLEQFPQGSQIAVLDTRPGPAAFQVHAGAARRRIERLATAAGSRPLAAVVQDAVTLLDTSELARHEVYVFTDLARASWPAESAAQLRQSLRRQPDLGIYIIDVGVEQPINTALGNLRLSDQVLASRATLRISTRVTRRGPPSEQSVGLFLLDWGENPTSGSARRKRDERIVTLADGAAARVEFEVGGLSPGIHQGYVQLGGEDGLACDDRRWFTLEVQPAWRVLVAAPPPADRSSLFLIEALAPAAFRRERAAPFQCDLVGTDALGSRSLDDYAAVWLLDPPPLEGDTWRKLEDFVARGGGLAIGLGRRAKPVDAFNHPAAQALLPGKLLRQARRPDGSLYLRPGEAQHPILRPFHLAGGTVPWEGFPVFRYWQLDQAAASARAIIPYSDGRPAVLERSLAGGRVLTLTTPISEVGVSDPWNLLPVGEAWPFVMLVNGITSYLVGSSDRQFNYVAGETVVLQLAPEESFPSYAMRTPGGVDVRLTPDLDRHRLVIASAEEVGNYRVAAGGSDSGARHGFSVNLAQEATRLDRLDRPQLARFFGDAAYQVARRQGELEGNVSRGRVGRELCGWLLALWVLALGAEHVLANRFYRDG